MVKHGALLAALAVVGLLTGCATRNVPQGDTIMFVSIGNLPQNQVIRTADFVRQVYGCRTRISPVLDRVEPTPEKQARKLASLRQSSDLFVVGLLNIPEDVRFREAYFGSQGVAMVNVWALRPNAVDSQADAERYMRRVERETVRAIGHLCGLPACPNPQCALFHHSNERELDSKARELCPPCRSKAHAILQRAGVAMPPDLIR